MPIEIRELIIRTTVDKQNKKTEMPASGENCSAPSREESNQVRISEVLKMIKNQNER